MVGLRQRVTDIYNQLVALASSINKGYYLTSHFATGSDTGGIQEALATNPRKTVFIDTLQHDIAVPIDIISGDDLRGFGWWSLVRPVNGLDDSVIKIDTNAQNFNLSNFRIDGNKANQASGSLIHAANGCFWSRIHHCWLFDGKERGIDLRRGSAFIRNMQVYNNHVEGMDGNYALLTYDALYSNVFNNVVTANTTTGIGELGGSLNIGIINNQCYNNGSRGIYLSTDGCSALVQGNTCFGNAGYGIELYPYGTSQILNNLCYLNGNHGIQLRNADHNFVMGNRCHDNGLTHAGIYLMGASYENRIFHNTCVKGAAAQQDWGIYLDAATYDNVILNNYNYWNAINDYIDLGTNNKWPYRYIPTPTPNGNQGNFGVTNLPDGADVSTWMSLVMPDQFSQIMKAYAIVIPIMTGTLRWNCDTHFGQIDQAAKENYNQHTDGIVSTDSAVTLNKLELLDISTAFTGIDHKDAVGFRFDFEGAHANNTVDAGFVGVIMFYA